MEEQRMRSLALALSLLAAAGGTAAAQPKPAPAATAPAEKKLTIDSTFFELIADPRTKAVLDKHMPGFTERMLGDQEIATMFGGVTLAGMAVDPDHGRMFTPEVLAMFTRELAAAQEPPKPAT